MSRIEGQIRTVLAIFLCLAVVLWWGGQWRQLPAPEMTALKVPCLSYAPFRRPGDSPFKEKMHVPIEQIEEDLRLIKNLSACVRTYGVNQGLEAVPAVARKLGMRVKLGAWMGRDEPANQAELTRAIALSNEYSDVIDVLVVGNEVLLRQELKPDALAALLDQARREVRVPVTYADVWEFWNRNAFLAKHVDLLAIHVLPYWEDEPIAVHAAVDHVYGIMRKMKANFPGKDIWLSETGWPSQGRQRREAIPGRFEQALFVRSFLKRLEIEPLQVNFIEAFDQPWKRDLEGAMGGGWGLMDARGVTKFSGAGPLLVGDVMHWLPEIAGLIGVCNAGGSGCGKRIFIIQVSALLLFTGLGFFLRRWRGALVLATVCLLAMAHIHFMQVWLRSGVEWVWSGLFALAVGGVIVTFLKAKSLVNIALLLSLFLLACQCLVLVFDPRYRGFPVGLVLVPALALCLSEINERFPIGHQLLALVITICAFSLLVLEGWLNTQALVFSLCALLVSFFVFRGAIKARALA